MDRRPPSITRHDTVFPNMTLFRSDLQPAPGRLRRGVDPGHAETDGLRPRAFQRHLPDRDHRLHGFLHLPRAGDAAPVALSDRGAVKPRSEEHTSELQSLMRISYAVFCLKKKKQY